MRLFDCHCSSRWDSSLLITHLGLVSVTHHLPMVATVDLLVLQTLS
jgi:hypothetical protein